MKIEKYGKMIVRDRLRQDYDLVVAITGEEGVGKSVCAIQLAKAICSASGLKFDLLTNEIYSPTPAKILNKISKLPKYSAIVLDEALKIAFKWDWSSPNSRYLSKFIGLCRKENKCLIMCIPRFTDLNTIFRNHRVKLWIHVVTRGTAVAFSPDRSNVLAPDHWHTDENYRFLKGLFKRKKFHSITVRQTVYALKKTQIFVVELGFEDITPEEKAIYEAERDRSKYRDISELGREMFSIREKRHMFEKGLMLKMLLLDGHTHTDIINKIGLAAGTPHEWLKRLPQISISEVRPNYNNKIKFIEFIKKIGLKV